MFAISLFNLDYCIIPFSLLGARKYLFDFLEILKHTFEFKDNLELILPLYFFYIFLQCLSLNILTNIYSELYKYAEVFNVRKYSLSI